MSQMRTLRIAIVTATFAGILPKPASGQVTGRVPDIAITPHAGMYIPLGSLVADNTVRLRPVAAIAVGSRMEFPMNARWAVESAFTWSPNLVAHSDWKETVDLEGGVLFSSARARLRLNQLTSRGEVVVTVLSGLGVVHRYGDAWSAMHGVTDVAAVVGGGLRYVELESGFSFVLDVENYMTRTGYTDDAGQRYGGRMQSDVLISFGISIDLGRR